MAPSFQRIVRDVHFNGDAGSGWIVDANASLGGRFTIIWSGSNSPLPNSRPVPAQPSGYWDINLEFC
jgi:hypothetical protein